MITRRSQGSDAPIAEDFLQIGLILLPHTFRPKGGETTITMYDEAFEAWRREYRSEELQPLKHGFFKEIASYIRRLKEAQRNLDPKSLKAQILEEEIERLQRLVNQLVNRRLEKIKESSGKNEHHTPDIPERWIVEEIEEITRHVTRFKEDIAQGTQPSDVPEKRKETVLIRFVKDLPAIIGVDLQTHGPFKTEDVASLPFENAESLIRQGAAVEIRAKQ